MHFYSNPDVKGLYHIENVGSKCYLYFNEAKGFGCDSGNAQPWSFPVSSDYIFRMSFLMDGSNMHLQIYKSEDYVIIDTATE